MDPREQIQRRPCSVTLEPDDVNEVPTELLVPVSFPPHMNTLFELSSNRFCRFRKYAVYLTIRSSWRKEKGLAESDVFTALVGSKCCKLGTTDIASCDKCGCSPAVVISTTMHAPIVIPGSDLETYVCSAYSRCSSSRDHLKSSLVLIVNDLPETKPITSPAFVLHARDKKSKKREREDFLDRTSGFVPDKKTAHFTHEEGKEHSDDQRAVADMKNMYPETYRAMRETQTTRSAHDHTHLMPEHFVSMYLLAETRRHMYPFFSGYSNNIASYGYDTPAQSSVSVHTPTNKKESIPYQATANGNITITELSQSPNHQSKEEKQQQQQQPQSGETPKTISAKQSPASIFHDEFGNKDNEGLFQPFSDEQGDGEGSDAMWGYSGNGSFFMSPDLVDLPPFNVVLEPNQQYDG